MSTDTLQVPQSDAKDVAHVAAYAVLNAIPFIGAGEIFKFIVTPSLEKRRDQWMEDVAQLLRELAQKSETIVDSLKENDEFQTLLYEASLIAVRTHLDDKRRKLVGVLQENAEGKVSFDKASYRMRILDQLIPVQIQIVRNVTVGHFHLHPTKAAATKQLGQGLDSSVTPELLKTLVQDLENLGVIKLKTSLHDEEPLYHYERTEFGWL